MTGGCDVGAQAESAEIVECGGGGGPRHIGDAVLQSRQNGKPDGLAERDEAQRSSREAFVAGAKWGHFRFSGSTQFPSETDEAEKEAEKRFPFAPWAHLEQIAALKALLREILSEIVGYPRLKSKIEEAHSIVDHLRNAVSATG